jgi:hypothetical protein
VPAVARFVPHWRNAATDVVSESPAVLGESVLRILAWLAGESAALLVLEDLHWADADTLAVCEYLVDHVSASPVVVVATVRPGSSVPDLAALLEGCLGAPPPSAVADPAARGGGWPSAADRGPVGRAGLI